MAALGIFWFAPKLRRYEVSFRYELPTGDCVSGMSLDVFSGDDRIRGFEARLQGERQLSHQAKLPPGEFVLAVHVFCENGDAGPLFQPMVVHQSGTINLNLSERCQCRGT